MKKISGLIGFTGKFYEAFKKGNTTNLTQTLSKNREGRSAF